MALEEIKLRELGTFYFNPHNPVLILVKNIFEILLYVR